MPNARGICKCRWTNETAHRTCLPCTRRLFERTNQRTARQLHGVRGKPTAAILYSSYQSSRLQKRPKGLNLRKVMVSCLPIQRIPKWYPPDVCKHPHLPAIRSNVPLVHHTSGMLVINVHADTILFRPQIGNRLLGVVRHLSLDGIVVAVLGIFLGVIRSEDVASLMTFNPETECFQYKSDPETMIQIGNAILFTVTQLHHGGEFFSIRGSMTDIRKEGLCWEEAGHVVYRTPQRKRLRTE